MIDGKDSENFPLSDVRPRMAQFVGDNVQRNDFDEPAPAEGYSVLAWSAAAPTDRKTPRTARLWITPGGEADSEIIFGFGDRGLEPDPELTRFPVYRKILEVIASTWPCPWACVYAFSSGYQQRRPDPSTPNILYSKFHIPWIAYLSAPLAAGLSLPPELMAERTPGGGVILTATTEQLDPENPDHFRRARALSQILIERAGGAELPPRIEPF
jgi:hypothetical protein